MNVLHLIWLHQCIAFLSCIIVSWQKGLVEREINAILRGLTQQQRKKVPTAVSRWRRPASADSDAKEVLPQRDIAEDDVCPICQDELLLKRLPVTYCKYVKKTQCYFLLKTLEVYCCIDKLKLK